MTNVVGNDFCTITHEEENELLNVEAERGFERELPSSNIDEVEPYEGMEFKSKEDAVSYYTRYAKKTGFSLRMNRITKSRTNGVLIGQEVVCSKEGFRAKKYLEKKDRINEPPDETRTGCKAMIYVSKKGEDKWVISRFMKDHNHILASPGSAQFLRVHRKKTRVQKKLIDVLDESGVRPSKIMSVLSTDCGGIDNVGLSQQDILNYLSGRRQKQLEKGDAQLMLSYFKKCQSKSPGFFYAIQMDVEGQLANCFWADARSRMAYKYFGDVVTFDPTYLTNRYKMPFVPFTGVNHHRQSILFGCALLWDETEETFVWLLNTWLEAMFGCHPKTIITDQDSAITNAVAKVLPGVTHHYCMWHIEKKIPEYLSHVYHEFDDFKNQFYKCIHESITIEEFESDWEALLDRYELQDNQWLKKIYSIREKWVPAFVRSTFCAGMSTTQRSESMNKFFKDFLNSSTPLSKFVVQYEKALDARYHKEREKTFRTLNSKPVFRTLYPMEEEASKIYTRKMFRVFQNELVSSQKFVAEKIEKYEEVYTYKVHEISREKPNYRVTLHLLSMEATCNCHMFEFSGILCRHVFTVFIKKKIHVLPTHFILSRWTMDAKKEIFEGVLSENFEDKSDILSTTLLFNNVMAHSMELSERATRSTKHHDAAIKGLQKLIGELDSLEIEDPKENFISSSNQVDVENSNYKSDQVASNAIVTLRDPPCVVTKGHPRSLRMKGSLELSQRCSVTCSFCKQKGHTKRTCERLKKPRI